MLKTYQCDLHYCFKYRSKKWKIECTSTSGGLLTNNAGTLLHQKKSETKNSMDDPAFVDIKPNKISFTCIPDAWDNSGLKSS
jgi:hypothetical protein